MGTMATIKSYTDLEQSKKLAEILPIESADMWYQYTGISIKDGSEKPIYFPMVIRDNESDEDIPCWSLAALLNMIPNYKLSSEHNYHTCTAETPFGKETVAWFDNPIDACVAMIEKLHELKMLLIL
jgi:hypothetical protein